MLINTHTPTFITEAAPVASPVWCRHSFAEKRKAGSVRALAGRYVR
jgi:hypothetical protein